MKMCDCVAQKSKDPSTKVGAVIVGPDHEIRSTGYNGFPRGAADDLSNSELVWRALTPTEKQNVVKARLERPLKYAWVVHAEQNAIVNAARIGTSTKGCCLYVNAMPPCQDCSKLIVQAGISMVVLCYKEIPERWRASCDIGNEILCECGVHILNVHQQPKEKP
jgi:dCMP deaminase